MKKSLGIVGGAAVATVLVAASPASAGTAGNAATGKLGTTSVAQKSNVANAAVYFSVTNARCTATTVKFTARTGETGFSGVQRFRQRAQLQYLTTAGWRAYGSIKTVSSTSFPNDGRNFSFTLNWTGTHPATGTSWREVWKGQYLNRFGQVIAQTRPVTILCR